jgi:hypothetical protein
LRKTLDGWHISRHRLQLLPWNANGV